MNNIGGIDLTEFKRQKDAITQGAAAEVATRIQQIETLLAEIKYIKEATGIEISLYNLKNTFDNLAADVDGEWYSSSYAC